jgi:hypothetical protein
MHGLFPYYDFFVVGGIAFWSLLLLFFIAVVGAIETESVGAATFFFLAFVAVLSVFSSTPAAVLQFVHDHYWIAMSIIPIYLLMGCAWSFGKWWFFVHNAKFFWENTLKPQMQTAYAEAQQNFKDYTDRKVTYAYTDPGTWKQFLIARGTANSYPPQFLRNKAKLVMWAAYWPMSAFWTLLNDPIKRFFRFVINRFGHLYQRISNSVFAQFSDDFDLKA